METSADGTTTVGSEASLFAGSGSAVAEVTLAVFVTPGTSVVGVASLFDASGSDVPDDTAAVSNSVPGAVVVATTAIPSCAPLASPPRSQLTSPSNSPQLP